MAPSALLTDFYQITMMSGYYEAGRTEERCVFELFFRKLPFQGGFCVAAGLGPALEYLAELHFTSDDIDYLKGLGLFSPAFLGSLSTFRFTGDVWAVPEGTLVFPNQPLLRIEAGITEAQLVESALINVMNFQTLIATKAARVCHAANGALEGASHGGEVLEFGMRRAQGPDGAMSASRAAYIGGCSATSNTMAGKVYGIPVRGTQAHSWIMSFPDELAAFRGYAARYPDHCLLLVDTYDTLHSGVPNAIQVARELAAEGHRLLGIRLDSGDLAVLSREARRMLDEAGFPDAQIVASNDLDESIIESLRLQGARIDTWGVGTQLVTAKNDPALGGVYKLVAIESAQGFRPCMKVSSNPEKVTGPGVKQVYRGLDADGQFVADCIALAAEEPPSPDSLTLLDPLYVHKETIVKVERWEPLLQCVMRQGRALSPPDPLLIFQQRARRQLEGLPQASRRLKNPNLYPVGYSQSLFDLRSRLLQEYRER